MRNLQCSAVGVQCITNSDPNKMEGYKCEIKEEIINLEDLETPTLRLDAVNYCQVEYKVFDHKIKMELLEEKGSL